MGPDQIGVKMELTEGDTLSISGGSGTGFTIGSQNGVKPVSPEQEELIHRLVYFQNEFEQPSEEDLKRITVSIQFQDSIFRKRMFISLA